MKLYASLIVCILLLSSFQNVNKMKSIEKETITFPATDGLTITADLYEVSNPKSTILLCHQAGFSRGEYMNSVKRLNKMGYSCLAIDQRSGETVNGVKNETAALANEKGLGTTYLDAKRDVESAIKFLFNKNKWLSEIY